MNLNGNYWYVSNMIRQAGNLEELEVRANNLGLSLRNETGGWLSGAVIWDTLQRYFDKRYPKNARTA